MRFFGVATMSSVLLLAVVAAICHSLLPLGTGPSTATETPPVRLLALVAPRQVVADDRYVAYAGLDALPDDATVLFRICDSRMTCFTDRKSTIGTSAEWWGWLGEIDLPEGQYEARLFVLVPYANKGFRTVALKTWSVSAGG